MAPELRIVLMGVAGSGKTIVGRLVATELGVPFVDADDYHSPMAVAAMRAGRPLDDAARASWLQRINGVLRTLPAGGFVLACSALKRAYRDDLRAATDGLLFVHLDVDRGVLLHRLAHRQGHFAGADLLPSQLATLELGDDVLEVAADGAPDAVARSVLEAVTRVAPPASHWSANER